MSRARAFAKINLALIVGPLRGDGKHEILTVLQEVELHDDIALERSTSPVIEGFTDDTIVRAALASLGVAAGVEPNWRVRIDKRVPLAAGLGGGSSDAAAALRLANDSLAEPLSEGDLHRVAAGIGADVPFFLQPGAQLASGDGTELERIELPVDYHVLLVVPDGVEKESTAAVYAEFDSADAAADFDNRAAELRRALGAIRTTHDLANLPSNNLVSSPLAAELAHVGAFRADVTGAGTAVYGLFEDQTEAERARTALEGRVWTALTRPVAGY
jgi:4-diphosphocytidyl-2-C-methyl-D-erythritol kinase